MRKAALLVGLCIFSACATAPEGMKQVKSSDKIVYRLPSEDIDSSDPYWGVSFNVRSYECVRSGYKYKRSAFIAPKSEDRCEIRFASVITPTYRRGKRLTLHSSRTYLFEVKKKKKKGVATVEFRPRYEALRPDPDFAGAKVSPPDTLENAMELLATSGYLTFQFEIKSPKDSGSILAGFRKYCKEESHLQNPVAIKNRTFLTSFLLASGGTEIARFYVVLSPEPKGTKASVITRVPLLPDANYQVDAVSQAADMKHVLAEIINN